MLTYEAAILKNFIEVYILCTIKFMHFKCRIQCLLVNLPICARTPVIWFYNIFITPYPQATTEPFSGHFI